MELAVIIIMILGKYFAVIGAQVAILGTRPGAPGATIAGCIANLISIRTLHIDKIVMAGHKVTKAVPEFQINEYTIWDIRLEIYIYCILICVILITICGYGKGAAQPRDSIIHHQRKVAHKVMARNEKGNTNICLITFGSSPVGVEIFEQINGITNRSIFLEHGE